MTSLMPRRSLTAREKMVVVSPCEREEEPGQRVDGDADAAAQGQQDEPDPDEGDVDAGGLGEASAHPGQHPERPSSGGSGPAGAGADGPGPGAGGLPPPLTPRRVPRPCSARGAVRVGWWFWVGRGGHIHPGVGEFGDTR